MSFDHVTCNQCKETHPIAEVRESWYRLHFNLRLFSDTGAGKNRHFCSNECLVLWLREQADLIENIDMELFDAQS